VNVDVGQRARTPGWVAPLTGLLVFLVVLVVGGLVTADWIIRNNEMKNLVTAIEASEQQMVVTQDQVTDAFRPFEVGGALTPEETAVLTQKLAGIATDAEARIAQAGRGVEAVSILAWHTDIKDAQDVYLVHNRAWVDYMARAAQDPVEFVNPQPLVNESFLAAEPVLKAAVPIPALYQLQQRVAQIFIDGIPEDMMNSEVSSRSPDPVVALG
jgi:hypothetical protein